MALEWDQTVDVLAAISAYDGRNVVKEDVALWMEAINRIPNLGFDESLEAVKRHFATSEQWFKPAHFRLLVGAVRQDEARKVQRDAARKALPPGKLRPPPQWFTEWRAKVKAGEADPTLPPIP